MTTTKPPEPAERSRTLRQSILDELLRGPVTARELSSLVGLRERDIIPHLEHLERSLRRGPRQLVIEPAECKACGYLFEDRRRLGKPSACPRCREQRIDPASFHVVGP
ncbi:MAG: transcriptional regulator [Pseudomonadota bacterium]